MDDGNGDIIGCVIGRLSVISVVLCDSVVFKCRPTIGISEFGFRESPCRFSSKNFLHHMPRHIGQAEMAALVEIGEAGVIESHQVQDRGMEVVNVDGILGDVVAEVIGRAVDDAGFHATAGHPH